MEGIDLKMFTDWLLENHYMKTIRGFYYSSINAHSDGQLFTFEQLLQEYHLDIYAKVVTNILIK